MSKTKEIHLMIENSKRKLEEFVKAKLLDQKIITKSYSHSLSFSHSLEARGRVLEIVYKEFLKRNPMFKNLQSISLYRRGNSYLYSPKGIRVLERYVRRLQRKISESGFPDILNIRVSPYAALFHRIEIRLNSGTVSLNPFRIIFFVEDMIQVLETLSRAVILVDSYGASDSGTPIYQTRREIR